jgi:hypothetical protein
LDFVNILQQIRSRGLFFSFAVLFNRVVPATVFRCRVFRVYQLSADALAPPPKALSLEVSKCDLPTESELAREVTRTGHGSWNSPATECWLCRDDDQAIGGVWIGHDFFCESDLGVTVVLGQQQCWLFSAFVQKHRRGAGVYRCLLGKVLEQCQPKTVFCAINPTNRASMAAHDQWIQRSLGTFFALRFLGLAICLSHGAIRPRRFLALNCRTAPIEIDLTLLS